MPREQERIPYLIEAVLEFASAKHAARISDLSEGGCYIDSIVQVREGDNVAFEIASPEGRVIRFTGDVAYILDGSGFGIRFTELSEDQDQYLHRLIEAHQ